MQKNITVLAVTADSRSISATIRGTSELDGVYQLAEWVVAGADGHLIYLKAVVSGYVFVEDPGTRSGVHGTRFEFVVVNGKVSFSTRVRVDLD